MSAFYDRMEATARRLLDGYGFDSYLIRDGAPTGPPHDPQPGADVRQTCRIVETSHWLTDREATLVQTGDSIGLMSTKLAVLPKDSDRIEVLGDQFHFVMFKPLRPGGQSLLYKFIARR